MADVPVGVFLSGAMTVPVCNSPVAEEQHVEDQHPLPLVCMIA